MPSTPKKPWLSVILPTRNGEAFLASTLESLLAQNDEGIEVVAIDDGSSDSSVQILSNYQSKLNLQVHQRDAQSWVKNSNFGIQSASGEFITLLHQDDYWLPSRVDTLKHLISKHPDTDVFLNPSLFVDDCGKTIGRWGCPLPKGALPRELLISRLLVQNFIAIPAPVFRRAAAQQIGPMDESLWFTADWKLWLQLADKFSWYFHPKELTCFRIHADSQTLTGPRARKSYRPQFEDIKLEFDNFDPPQWLEPVSMFSRECNIALAESLHGEPIPVWSLCAQAMRLGPIGMYRYWNYSRIGQRVFPRLRAGLHKRCS